MRDRKVGTPRLVSFVLNPSLWVGGLLVFAAIAFEPAGFTRWMAAAVSFVFVTAVPIATLFALKALDYVSDVEMSKRSERELVYLACTVSYAVGGLWLFLAGASWPLWGLVGLHVPYAILLTALNRKWKVSIHTAGMAGMWAAALVLFGMGALPLGLAVAVAGWGRWAAGAHSPGELAGGAVFGFALTASGLYALELVAGT